MICACGPLRNLDVSDFFENQVQRISQISSVLRCLGLYESAGYPC